jgi:O-antigen/teichoic acid export membrane protein
MVQRKKFAGMNLGIMRKFRELSGGVWATISNIGWLSMDRIVRMGGALLVGTLVARYLAPAAFGMVSLATAIYLLFNTVSNLGLDYLMVRDVVLHPDEIHEVMGTAFWMKAAASVITTAFAVLFVWLTHPGQLALVAMVALMSVASISQAWDVIDYFFQAKTLSRLTVIPKLIAFLLANVARLLAVYLRLGVMTFVVITAAEMLFGEIGLLVSYRLHQHGIPNWRWNRTRARLMLRQGLPLVAASFLVMVYMRTDQIMLGYFLGERSVGYYSAAVRISEIWYAIPMLTCNSVMPRLLRALHDDKALYYRRLQGVYNGLALISVSLGLLTLPLSRWMVTFLFGQAYISAAHILNIHIWTGVFVFIGVLGGQQLIHEGLSIVELRRAGAGAMVNLLLNFLLIPRYGIAGSAFATLAAQIMSSYLMDVFSARTRHIFRMKSYALSGLWLLRREFNWTGR